MIEQLSIALFGVVAVWLSQSDDANQRKWAPIFGLLSQPFWFITTINNEQWGMVAICVLYSWSWSKGVYIHWIKNHSQSSSLKTN